MSLELSISYLTGSKKVLENYLYQDVLVSCQPRTLGQMFFQPYESKKEFIYCARHTFAAIALIAWAVLDPYDLIGWSFIHVGMSAVLAAIGGISKLCGDERNANLFLSIAKGMIQTLCQMLIDSVVLPLSALAMLTRGISTGLHAAGIIREDGGAPPLGM